MIAEAYWTDRFSTDEGIKHHSKQNTQISKDFIREVRQRKSFADVLQSPRMIEVGCGTGDLCALIERAFAPEFILGTDFTRAAVNAAQARHPEITFWKFDILRDTPFGPFDLAICSNVLEHFQDYETVVWKLLGLAPRVIILVPYAQPITDQYDEEGGAGHANEFRKRSFSQWRMIDSFLFETQGWTYSSAGEKPKQLAVLLGAKKS